MQVELEIDLINIHISLIQLELSSSTFIIDIFIGLKITLIQAEIHLTICIYL